ncbi:hypothetical protein AB205_0075190 [Aquarana catesbeiana]|uniref:Uncharacterized protein n=1 Tax=Aquarana catesbeiana TaxID=8400 RepID=A0A2G9S954_AQUCT|nr:hypothetical protein AB205_0075190 [Aquarana catesbeiana]
MCGILCVGIVYTRSEFPTTDFVVEKFEIQVSNFCCRKFRQQMSNGSLLSETPTLCRLHRTFVDGNPERVYQQKVVSIITAMDTFSFLTALKKAT